MNHEIISQPRNVLAHRILLPLMFLWLIGLGGIVLSNYSQMRTAFEETVESRASMIVSALSDVMETGSSYTEINRGFVSFGVSRDVKVLFLLGQEGDVLISTNHLLYHQDVDELSDELRNMIQKTLETGRAQSAFVDETGVQNGQRVYMFTNLVWYADQKRPGQLQHGALVGVLNVEEGYRALLINFAEQSFLQAALVFFALFLGSVLLHCYVFKPVRHLALSMDLHKTAEISKTSKGTELRYLAEYYNAMLARVYAHETELEEARNFLQVILDNVPDIIFVKDRDLNILVGNRAFCTLHGRPEKDLLGQGLYNYMSPEFADLAKREDINAFANGKMRETVLFKRPDAPEESARYIDIAKVAFEDRLNNQMLIGIGRDVTDQKIYQDTLQTLQDISADTELGYEERLQAFMRLGCETFGMDTALIGRVDGSVYIVVHVYNDQDAPASIEEGHRLPLKEAYCSRCIELGHVCCEQDIQHSAFVGKSVHVKTGWASYMSSPLFLHRRVFGAFTFVSSQPLKEPFSDRMQQLMEIMARSVAFEMERQHRAQEITTHAEALEESNETLRQFAEMASHDLQEPLRMVASYCTLLKQRYGKKLGEDADEFIDYAVEGSNRMQDLVQGLLDYSRMGRAGLHTRSVDAGELVRESLMFLHSQIATWKVDVDIEGTLATLDIDPSLGLRVFQNIIGNAIKYRREGVLPTIRISQNIQGAQAVFAIQDNGMGIPEHAQNKVFEMFRRLHGAQVDGAGMGLAICKRIVEMHGGRLWVESKLGEGSTFYFSLPLAKV